MNMKPHEYESLVKQHAKKSPILKNCLRAFLVGGVICTLGQGLTALYTSFLHLSQDDAGTLCAATLILLAAVLTGVGLFDVIAKYAGAGTLVPITGFANAVSAAAVEFQTDECDIIGLSRKAIQFMASMMI